jgi:release factor glutamine methyltransferase
VTRTTDAAVEIWTIRRLVAWGADDLKKHGINSPRLDVELLLGKVLALNRVGLLVDSDRPLSKSELGAYRALHVRRRAQEPVAYLLGVREFFGRPFRVDNRVLVPRPDTEILVEVALDRTRARSMCARVLDLCTGSGCVAVTLARERPTTQVVASDVSRAALVVARENALRLGAMNVGIVESDGFDAFRAQSGTFDLITANPPYLRDTDIASLSADIREYEPSIALRGGAEGLDLARRIVAQAPSYLDDGGVLALEIGADQGEAVANLFRASHFVSIDLHRDYGGHERVVTGVKRATGRPR